MPASRAAASTATAACAPNLPVGIRTARLRTPRLAAYCDDRPDLRLQMMAEDEDAPPRRGAIVGECDRVHPRAPSDRRHRGHGGREQRAEQQPRPVLQRRLRRLHRTSRRASGVVGLEREAGGGMVEHRHRRAVQHRPAQLAFGSRQRQQDSDDDRRLARPRRTAGSWDGRIGLAEDLRGGRRCRRGRFRRGRRRGGLDPWRRRSRFRHARGQRESDRGQHGAARQPASRPAENRRDGSAGGVHFIPSIIEPIH